MKNKKIKKIQKALSKLVDGQENVVSGDIGDDEIRIIGETNQQRKKRLCRTAKNKERVYDFGPGREIGDDEIRVICERKSIIDTVKRLFSRNR